MNFLLDKFIEFMSVYNVQSFISITIFSVLPFLVIISMLVFTVICLVLAERKLLGYFTQRKGPNRVGPWGIFQTVADAIKLLCKENIELTNSDKVLFTLAPILAFSSIILLWCIIPYNDEFYLIKSIVTLVLFVIIASFPMLFHFLAGYASNNKYSILGAYRTLALTVSYCVPMIFCLLSIVFLSNSMDLVKIVHSQESVWFIIKNFLGFVIFYIVAVAKLNRCPFDLTEAESELVCGYHTEYSGMRFAMFFLGEYAELFVMSMLIAILFLGGYLPPFNIYLSNIFSGNCVLCSCFLYLEQTLWLIFKTVIILFSVIWVRATLPRLTQLSVLKLFWHYLAPVSVVNLIILIVLNMRVIN